MGRSHAPEAPWLLAPAGIESYMPTLVTCPSCNRPLRVPDSLLGKRVQCPNCGTTFTADADAGTPTAAPEQEAPRPAPPIPPEEEYEEERPARRRRPAREEEDYEDDEPPEDDYDEDRPRRRRRRF